MSQETIFDVIIIGGSYTGLSAAMTLGRSLRKVLIIDAGKPCNRHSPHSHNFLTQDGVAPAEIAALGREQVLKYPTVHFKQGLVNSARKVKDHFEAETSSGQVYHARRILLATGVNDLVPEIPGFADCWGKTIVHCPFCHGYEIKGLMTGILGNGEGAFHMLQLLRNWTPDLMILTNGQPDFSEEMNGYLQKHPTEVISKDITSMEHQQGSLQRIVFSDGTSLSLPVMYAHVPFEQHTTIAEQLGCTIQENGLIAVSEMKETNITGLFAAGDCTSPMRSVAFSVQAGNLAGVAILRSLLF